MAGGKFCPKCGFGNPPERGACLMCYARLDQKGGGRQCPHCGGEVSANATFCATCGGALVEGVTAVPGTLAMAALLMETGGEVFAGGGYHEPAAAPAAEHLDDFAAVGESEIPSGTVSDIPSGTVSEIPSGTISEIPSGTVSEIPSGTISEIPSGTVSEVLAEEAAAPFAPVGVEEEEEMFVPPPPGLVAAEEAAPPSPPPAAEEFAPPPPPPPEEFAPPPPPPLEDEGFAPPPPPPDMMDLSEEPPPAPPAPAAIAGASGGPETADFDFGDWALELPEEEIDGICQAIRNHEAFVTPTACRRPSFQLISDCLYDADKFRWGPDNFTATVWSMVAPVDIPLSVLLDHFIPSLGGIERIKSTFRTGTGRKYGPDFIDRGLQIGMLIYRRLCEEMGRGSA